MASVAALAEKTVGFAEAKNSFSALTTQANDTGIPFTILKNNRPWVEVRPLAVRAKAKDSVVIKPVARKISVVDLDHLFAGYEDGFVAQEDGFARPAGREVI